MCTAARTVLVIDDDHDIARLVEALLTDECYDVAILHDLTPDAVARAVGREEPDCILLDGESPKGFGSSWELSESLAVRGRPVPVVMFTAHGADEQEARDGASARSRAAHLSGVLSKPFDLDELIGVVEQAVGRATPFDRLPEADAQRSQELVDCLKAGGASEIHRSARREWVTFRAPSGRTVQLYWWQTLGLYLCGAYDDDTGRMVPLGEFVERELAIACTLSR